MQEIIKQMEQQLAKLPEQLPKPLISLKAPMIAEKGLSRNREMSVYWGDLNLKTVLQQNLRIAKAFPQLPEGFYEILNQRLREKEFTDKRLIDAVNHVIDTCQYPIPTAANFLSYDRSVEILTHSDLVGLLSGDKNVFDKYEPIRLPGSDMPLYARKEDVIKYGLVKWNK